MSSARRGAGLLALGLMLLACKAQDDGSESGSTPGLITATAPQLRAETSGVLFVWIGEQGQFKTTGQLSEVPQSGQKLVRVIFEKSAAPAPDAVWITHLDQRRADGSYVVTTLARAEWEKQGLSDRQARVDALRPPPAEPPSGDATGTTAQGVDVVIYGADWCKPCHQAEAYLKKLGARVVKKDIEEDATAASEMRKKLQAAGLGGSGIPVLDIGGTLLVGFSESAIDAALARLKK